MEVVKTKPEFCAMGVGSDRALCEGPTLQDAPKLAIREYSITSLNGILRCLWGRGGVVSISFVIPKFTDWEKSLQRSTPSVLKIF